MTFSSRRGSGVSWEARARRYTLPYRDVVRAKIVLMAAAGLGNDEIAARLGTRREVVSKWRKRFFGQGLAGLAERPRGGRPPAFPPDVVVAVKALACELPLRLGVPLSRLHVPGIAAEVISRGIVAEISGTTIWRWLAEDAIRPWRVRSWIFPRDPAFEATAGRVLDLYARTWEGKPLGSGDFVLSADEKTPVQARIRRHPTLGPAPGRDTRAGHEYGRGGALAYLAAWDVHRAKVFGRCEPATGIEPFTRLAAQVMSSEPYASARRMFWVAGNGTSHRGPQPAARIRQRWPHAHLVHLPVHTPPGSTRSRSTSPSSSARCSPPPTSPASLNCRPAWPPSSATTSRPQPPSSGNSPTATWPSSWNG